MHKIPNCGFAKIDDRGVTRIFFPKLYQQETVTPLTMEQLATIYNECIRPAAVKVMPTAAGHWPPSYTAEQIRIHKHRRDAFAFGTVDVPGLSVYLFGQEVMKRIRNLEFGVDAFFGHTIRGTKGRTVHDPNDENDITDVLAEYLDLLILPRIRHADWYVDVALEYCLNDTVILWRTDSHIHIVRHALDVDEPVARRLSSVGSSCYARDVAAQLDDVSGFRLTPKTAGIASGVVYLNVYTTDKGPTYLSENGRYAKYITANEALSAKEGPIPFFEGLARVFRDASANYNGHARIEARVCLNNVLGYLRHLPADLLTRSLLTVDRHKWW
jgi:hypothetical protein